MRWSGTSQMIATATKQAMATQARAELIRAAIAQRDEGEAGGKVARANGY